MSFLTPIKKPHNNFILTGDPKQKIADLSATKMQNAICSVWKIENLEERKRFLETGEITLSVYGRMHPAVALYVGDLYNDILKSKGN